jgi:PRTRC genetic system protein E
MSLFTSLYPLAQKATLILLVTVEGDQLRVNVTPRANDDSKGEKPLYPLSLLATPDELDRDFAEAVSIYEPSVLSVLDQARAASSANASTPSIKAAPALPAPASSTKNKPGRRPKSAAASSEPADSAPESGADTPEADPRQTAIPGLESKPATDDHAEIESAGLNDPALDAAAAADADGVDIF